MNEPTRREQIRKRILLAYHLTYKAVQDGDEEEARFLGRILARNGLYMIDHLPEVYNYCIVGN